MYKVHDRLAISLDELATKCGVSVAFLRLEIKRGRLRVARVGRRILIPVQYVARWLGTDL